MVACSSAVRSAGLPSNSRKAAGVAVGEIYGHQDPTPANLGESSRLRCRFSVRDDRARRHPEANRRRRARIDLVECRHLPARRCFSPTSVHVGRTRGRSLPSACGESGSGLIVTGATNVFPTSPVWLCRRDRYAMSCSASCRLRHRPRAGFGDTDASRSRCLTIAGVTKCRGGDVFLAQTMRRGKVWKARS